METKFTDGRFYASPNGTGKGTSVRCVLPDDKGNIEIAICNFDVYRIAESLSSEKITEFDISTEAEEANAKLLSAAPEMYEMLKLIIGGLESRMSYDRMVNYIEAGKKALKKADTGLL